MPETIDMIDRGAIDAIVGARHGDPFSVLGPHDGLVRAFIPGADSVAVVERDTGMVVGTLDRVDPAGFFVGPVSSRAPYRLRIGHDAACYEIEDAYAFPPILGDMDIYLLAEGRHRDFARCLGAHPAVMEGVPGVRFAVWAPNAQRASVVGDFNHWDGRRHPMRKRHGPGVWELFIPRIGVGALYKYELLGPDGALLPLKADPVAWATQIPPETASIVADDAPPVWTDEAWIATRAARHAVDAPISIYEVHAGSWSPAAHMGVAGWDALADRLVPYAADMGFTHIELMPIMEHPFGGSWGYQPLGQFAPSSRLGSPEAFARFADRCHAAGLGIILDWVPAHFPTDTYGLAQFDGTALYEHQDPREGFHRDWNTLIYNLGRNEVRAFLIGSALFWLEHYHADGIRVDAVASMLYRDYSRNAGEWIPNRYGGRENLEAVSFLQDLSRAIAERVPGALLVAEESTAWPGVTRPADEGGLGFTYKWNMGWMHDTLHYAEEEPINRKWHHSSLTFGLIYAFAEKFILPLSHDEVVYGKGSLLGKMPGDQWQKLANVRAYLAFMWAHPGKQLLFMGSEFGQPSEWSEERSLDWWILDQPAHQGLLRMVGQLNRVYRDEPALWQQDNSPAGFEWLDGGDAEHNVVSFLRWSADGQPIAVLMNFSGNPVGPYRVGLPFAGEWDEILNTDAGEFGGSGVGNFGVVQATDEPWAGRPASAELTLPPLAGLWLKLRR